MPKQASSWDQNVAPWSYVWQGSRSLENSNFPYFSVLLAFEHDIRSLRAASPVPSQTEQF